MTSSMSVLQMGHPVLHNSHRNVSTWD